MVSDCKRNCIQSKASKRWNNVKGNPSDYFELVAKLEKRISSKKSKNSAVWRRFVRKTHTRNQANKKIQFNFNKYHSSTKVT